VSNVLKLRPPKPPHVVIREIAERIVDRAYKVTPASGSHEWNALAADLEALEMMAHEGAKLAADRACKELVRELSGSLAEMPGERANV
jgi:hypothetical protein